MHGESGVAGGGAGESAGRTFCASCWRLAPKTRTSGSCKRAAIVDSHSSGLPCNKGMQALSPPQRCMTPTGLPLLHGNALGGTEGLHAYGATYRRDTPSHT